MISIRSALRHKLLAAALALFAMVAAPAPSRASQGSQVLSLTDPGAPANQLLGTGGLADLINKAFLSISTMNSGTSAPANSTGGAPVAYQIWCDTTANPTICKLYDGASWIQWFKVDTSAHTLTLLFNGAFLQLSGNTGINPGVAGQIGTWAGGTLSGSATPTLGASGTLGSVTMGNGTSGLVTVQPVSGALGTSTASLPVGTYTLAGLSLNQTWSGANTFSGSVSFASLAFSATAPTISSGFCTSPSISSNNGSVAFAVTIGTGCAGSTGVLSLPTAAHGWACDVHDVTTPASNDPGQSASSTSSVTITNYSRTTGSATNFTSSDVLAVKCAAF